MQSRNTILYAFSGAVLAMGAPLGWLLWRTGAFPPNIIAAWVELLSHPSLYLYLALPTAVVFAAFGAALGTRADNLRAKTDALAAAALTDALTHLKNRRYFDERLRAELSRAQRDGSSLALLIADLDRFKAVNDAHGHAAGDRVLTAVGHVIATTCRAADSGCRVGGEEFAIICPASDASEAARLAERLRANVAAVDLGLGAPVTISVGVAVTSEHTATADVLFHLADKALYEAKLEGRNRVVVAGANVPETTEANWTLAHETHPGDD